MTDAEAVEATREGWDLLATWAGMIALLPLEDWLKAIDRAQAIGPITQPTLYRESRKTLDDIKDLIEAAMPLKRTVLKIQRRLRETGQAAPGA